MTSWTKGHASTVLFCSRIWAQRTVEPRRCLVGRHSRRKACLDNAHRRGACLDNALAYRLVTAETASVLRSQRVHSVFTACARQLAVPSARSPGPRLGSPVFLLSRRFSRALGGTFGLHRTELTLYALVVQGQRRHGRGAWAPRCAVLGVCVACVYVCGV